MADPSNMEAAEIRRQLEESQRRYPFPAAELARTSARRWILNHVKRGGVGAEIGVFRGHFSQLICEVAKPRKLYLIDPWTRLGTHFGWGADYTNNDALPTAVARDEARLRVALCPDVEAVVVEASFPQCRGVFAERLDYVYLDASHQYEQTLAELHAVVALLAHDGVIIGDDWRINPEHKHHGVFRACQRFVRESDFRIVAAGPAAQWCLKRIPD